MIETPDITRPSKDIVDRLGEIGSATIASVLARMGIRDSQLKGIRSWTPGRSVAGPALTLQCMPMREDQVETGEYIDPETQLHRHVLYHTQPGDVVVVDARGDMSSGIFGEMMLTYFMGKGGLGVVIDGCIRDYTHAQTLDLGLWLKGVTPNYHSQTNIFPFAVNTPVACGDRLVMPGDIIVADDDGAVVVPVAMAADVLKKAGEKSDREQFIRLRLSQGGELRKYYPLSEQAQVEYEAWRKEQG